MAQHSSLNKNYFIISILVHVFIALTISYMIKRDAISNKNFVIFGAHSRYTTKALYKSGTIPVVGKPSNATNSSGKKRSQSRTASKKSSMQKQASPIKKKTPLKKQTSAPTKQSRSKGSLTKNNSAIKEMPAPTALVEEKKLQSKKNIALKKKTKSKKELTHSKQNIAALPPMPVDTKVTEQEEPLESANELDNEESNKEESTNTPSEDLSENTEEYETIHVGVVDATNPVTRYHQQVISEEFNKSWQPPVGVRKGTECTVRISIGSKGEIIAIDFIKKSQVPIYDLSILRLKLAKPKFPSSLYNKHMIVVFHQ